MSDCRISLRFNEKDFFGQTKKESYENLIGLLAQDINNDSSCTDTYRIDELIVICDKAKRTDLIDELNKYKTVCVEMDNWFRDLWSGPYGGHCRKIMKSHLRKYYEYFTNPSYDLEDLIDIIKEEEKEESD